MFAGIFLELIQRNIIAGVRLSVGEHYEEDFKGKFKAWSELEELLATIKQIIANPFMPALLILTAKRKSFLSDQS